MEAGNIGAISRLDKGWVQAKRGVAVSNAQRVKECDELEQEILEEMK